MQPAARARRNGWFRGKLHIAGFALARWALLGAMLTIVMAFSSGVSQACESETAQIQPPEQSATHLVARPSAPVLAGQLLLGLDSTEGASLDHCDGPFCAYSRCPACSAAIAVEAEPLTILDKLLRIRIPLVHSHLLSIDSDPLFRPPRLTG